MTVYDLTFLFTEDYQKIAIYNLTSGKTVFHGTIEELNYDYFQYRILEVCSIDCIENNVLTINVEM